MSEQATERASLIAEYLAYRDDFNTAPNPYSVPNAREETGYCRQVPAPLQVAADLAGGPDPFKIGAFWSHVQSHILTTLHRESKGGA